MIEIPEFFVKTVCGMRRMGLKNSRAEKGVWDATLNRRLSESAG